MPRIYRADLKGKSLQELMNILQIAADDGTYSRHDVEKVLTKIRKRILDGHAMADNAVIDDVVDLKALSGMGGMEM